MACRRGVQTQELTTDDADIADEVKNGIPSDPFKSV